jgi:hypothetical protein
MNDTDSNIISLIDVDLLKLGDLSRYVGWGRGMDLSDAGGGVETLQMMEVQIRLVDHNCIPLTPWFTEWAVVRASVFGLMRLSGSGIRRKFYMATPKGNAILAMSTNKSGMTSLM